MTALKTLYILLHYSYETFYLSQFTHLTPWLPTQTTNHMQIGVDHLLLRKPSSGCSQYMFIARWTSWLAVCPKLRWLRRDKAGWFCILTVPWPSCISKQAVHRRNVLSEQLLARSSPPHSPWLQISLSAGEVYSAGLPSPSAPLGQRM